MNFVCQSSAVQKAVYVYIAQYIFSLQLLLIDSIETGDILSLALLSHLYMCVFSAQGYVRAVRLLPYSYFA